MKEYLQEELQRVAPPEVRAEMQSFPDSRRTIPVPTGVLNTMRSREQVPSTEDVLCGFEDESGLSCLRHGTRQMAEETLGGRGDVMSRSVSGSVDLKDMESKPFTMPD
ncbi:MAG: hypothetical protein WC604_00025 [Candidatus Gracilibacteria bacterium]